MGFFEICTSNLTFPFQKPIYPLIQKLKVIQNLMLVNFLKFFGIRSSLWGKQKNINLTSYHLFNATPNIIKIGHFSRKVFVARKKNTKLLVNFVTDVTVQISIEMPTSRYIRIHILPLEKV